jgi:hypothetical protein
MPLDPFHKLLEYNTDCQHLCICNDIVISPQGVKALTLINPVSVKVSFSSPAITIIDSLQLLYCKQNTWDSHHIFLDLWYHLYLGLVFLF